MESYQAEKDEDRTEMLQQIIRTMLSNGRTVAQISADLEMEKDRVIKLAGKSED